MNDNTMTKCTAAEAMTVATKLGRCDDLRGQIETAMRIAAKKAGAVFYQDVGPTGDWSVFGDCYDWAEANPKAVIELPHEEAQ